MMCLVLIKWCCFFVVFVGGVCVEWLLGLGVGGVFKSFFNLVKFIWVFILVWFSLVFFCFGVCYFD